MSASEYEVTAGRDGCCFGTSLGVERSERSGHGGHDELGGHGGHGGHGGRGGRGGHGGRAAARGGALPAFGGRPMSRS